MQLNLTSFMDYVQTDDLIRYQFLNEHQSDALCIEEEITLEVSLSGFLETVRGLVESADRTAQIEYMHGIHHSQYYIVTRDAGGKPGLLVQISWHSDGDINTAEKAVFRVMVTGQPDTAQVVIQLLRETFPERLARVRWWFVTKDQLNFHDVVLQKPSPVKAEYYPFMGDPMKYMNEYLSHNASLLFLSGPAGTGKTTLLRNFLYENRLRAVVTYEDTLFNSDQMFVDFVTSNNHDVMIIEDADIMLGSREHSGNKMIARFLNASDGIIQLHRKKIIFTTNLSNFNDVDEALIRPGRSYGSVIFRSLTPEESVVAAKAAGIKDWQRPDHDVSLAEIFNPPNSFGKRSVGFAV
jgi:hypothetical protein